MYMLRVRLVSALLLAALLSACASGKDEQEKELAAMRTELEQLTNALGRLEFRVYQLENQQLPDGVKDSAEAEVTINSSTNTAADPASDQSAPLRQSDKRFDLAPVE